MKFRNVTAVLTVFAISLGVFAAMAQAQEARPVVDTYAINVNGDPAGFVAAAKKIFAKADALGINSDRGIYVSEIGGTSTNMVYVIIEHASLGAMEAANAKLFATEEWAAFLKATEKMGQASTSRQILRELYSD